MRRSGTARLALVALVSVVVASAYLIVSAASEGELASLPAGPTLPAGQGAGSTDLPPEPTADSSTMTGPTASPLPIQTQPTATVAGWHVPVLMYHLVATPAEAGDARPGLVVAPALFDAQMARLRAAGWRTITAGALGVDLLRGTPPPARTFVVTIDDGHEDGFTEAFPILRADGFVATYFVPTERINHTGYLTAPELQTMVASGMEIADHTVSHAALTALPLPSVFFQVQAAATILGTLVGLRPATFAYPYGNVDPAVEAVVAADAFATAYTNRDGCSESTANRFLMPRIRISPFMTPVELFATLTRCGTRW